MVAGFTLQIPVRVGYVYMSYVTLVKGLKGRRTSCSVHPYEAQLRKKRKQL